MLVLAGTLAGCKHTTAEITYFNFSPNGTSNYDISCTGQRPTYSDVKLYTPAITLNKPSPQTFTYTFEVKEDKTGSDPTLGVFSMTIQAGQSSFSSMRTPADGGSGPQYVPSGAQDPETQGFWLACTAQCKVRANQAAGDDGHANVYIEMIDLGQPNFQITGNDQSSRHAVRCQTGGGGGGGSPEPQCESMIDCPRGDCVPGNGIGHYECLRNKCVCLPD